MEKDTEDGKGKQNRRVLIRPVTFMQLEALAKREECDVAELANRACRELLERAGLWPPPSMTSE